MDQKHLYRVPVQEIIVDVLGSLVPGLMCVIASILMLAVPAELLLTLCLRPMNELPIGQSLITPPEVAGVFRGFSIVLAVFLLITSYVVGHIFYRKGPKKPDVASFRWHVKNNPGEQANWVAHDESECRFPYPRLKQYLTARGLNHLAEIIHWGPENKEQCSKTFINALKVRLLFEVPDRCTLIAKNEAHIRLMSSAWYMARVLIWVGVISLLLVAADGALAVMTTDGLPAIAYLAFVPAAAMPLAGIGVSYWIRRNVEKFLHYQRVREAVTVLETAYIAFHTRPEMLQMVASPEFFGTPAERLPSSAVGGKIV